MNNSQKNTEITKVKVSPQFKNFALASIFAGLIITTFTGCTKQSQTANTVENENLADIDAETITQIVEEFLIVDQNTCIGCGKCVMRDSQHFMMDNSIRKAQVISQENLDSSALSKAISHCPVDAISV